MDKKIRELMSVCHVFELKTPNQDQITNILDIITPALDTSLKNSLIKYIDGDLTKLSSIYKIYSHQNSLMRNEIIQNIFQPKIFNEDSKNIAKHLIQNRYSMEDHNILMNETDRTTVGLLWHENIADVLQHLDPHESHKFYNKFLRNICFSDYIDRITFQKQIWQFNEMSSLIKTIYNNNLFHDTFHDKPPYNPKEVRFTKVLTKYSTEYNNMVFIQNLCNTLMMSQTDMISYFIELQSKYSNEEILQMHESYEIKKLDIQRLYRYINKLNNYTIGSNDKEVIIENENEIDDVYLDDM